MFFYLCTGLIKFAPLKSQGSEGRAQYIREEAEREPHAPPPCSPKVVHSLAAAVGFHPLLLSPFDFPRRSPLHIQLKMNSLRDLALRKIQSGITSANVIDEFFLSSAR